MGAPEVEPSLGAFEPVGRRRELRCVEEIGQCRVRVDGQQAVSFASCDYLGLAVHPELAAAAAQAAHAEGTSSGSARLLAGHDNSTVSLERELAETFGQPSALTFSSGYLANLGVVTALAGPGDLIVSDSLGHASTVDACRLSGAVVRVAPHNDMLALREALLDASNFRRVLVLVEGVYSMTGDKAPLLSIVELAEVAGAYVVVDDAHGLGAVGPGGCGTAMEAGVADRVAVQLGNLGKALGSFGGFALCDDRTRELLVQTSRSFMFTCALPPTAIAAARVALRVLGAEPERPARLQSNARLLRESLRGHGIDVAGEDSPIVSVVIGEDLRAVQLAESLLQAGWFVPAVRPPTVPKGMACLRLTVTAEHGEVDCRGVAAAVGEALS
ncbi:MAG: 8-amino-7-oxononanoate synthase [Planctomycetota bacterium]|nr:8-amino-7-oxononanoate synthase [Planctomycetota bacterium]